MGSERKNSKQEKAAKKDEDRPCAFCCLCGLPQGRLFDGHNNRTHVPSCVLCNYHNCSGRNYNQCGRKLQLTLDLPPLDLLLLLPLLLPQQLPQPQPLPQPRLQPQLQPRLPPLQPPLLPPLLPPQLLPLPLPLLLPLPLNLLEQRQRPILQLHLQGEKPLLP